MQLTADSQLVVWLIAGGHLPHQVLLAGLAGGNEQERPPVFLPASCLVLIALVVRSTTGEILIVMWQAFSGEKDLRDKLV